MGGARKKKTSFLTTILKYFVHGFLFALLFTLFFLGAAIVMGFVGAIVSLTSVFGFGFLLVFLIGLAILYIVPLIVGAANTIVANYLWFRVKFGFVATWIHGVAFILALAPIQVFVAAAMLALPQPWPLIFGMIVGAFVDGFIGKQIAGLWKVNEEETDARLQKPYANCNFN